MLTLNIGQAAEKIVVTLDELKTIDDPYYLFVFTNVTTKEVVSIIKNYTDDESSFPYRYNQFELATSTLFADKQVGQWIYEVYQQSSSSNTDPDASQGLVESGKMLLKPSTEFEYDIYNEPTTYKAYNG